MNLSCLSRTVAAGAFMAPVVAPVAGLFLIAAMARRHD